MVFVHEMQLKKSLFLQQNKGCDRTARWYGAYAHVEEYSENQNPFSKVPDSQLNTNTADIVNIYTLYLSSSWTSSSFTMSALFLI